MAEYVLFDEFHLIVRVPADLDEAACDVIRRVLEGRPFRADVRRALLRIVRQYPELAPVRVRITG
jgi:hypothetical protein